MDKVLIQVIDRGIVIRKSSSLSCVVTAINVLLCVLSRRLDGTAGRSGESDCVRRTVVGGDVFENKNFRQHL